MAHDEEVFDSIEAIRAHYYPTSAKLLQVDTEELLEFPERLADESLRTISRITAASKRKAGEPGTARDAKKGTRRAGRN